MLSQNFTQLINAINDNHFSEALQLLNLASIKNSAAINNNQALDLAIQKGNYDLVEKLLELPRVKNKLCSSQCIVFLRKALLGGEYNIIDLLLNKTEFVDALSRINISQELLMIACRLERLDIVNRLLETPSMINQLGNIFNPSIRLQDNVMYLIIAKHVSSDILNRLLLVPSIKLQVSANAKSVVNDALHSVFPNHLHVLLSIPEIRRAVGVPDGYGMGAISNLWVNLYSKNNLASMPRFLIPQSDRLFSLMRAIHHGQSDIAMDLLDDSLTEQLALSCQDELSSCVDNMLNKLTTKYQEMAARDLTTPHQNDIRIVERAFNVLNQRVQAGYLSSIAYFWNTYNFHKGRLPSNDPLPTDSVNAMIEKYHYVLNILNPTTVHLQQSTALQASAVDSSTSIPSIRNTTLIRSDFGTSKKRVDPDYVGSASSSSVDNGKKMRR